MSKESVTPHLRVIAGADTTPDSRFGKTRQKDGKGHLSAVVSVVESQDALASRTIADAGQGWLFPNEGLLGLVDMSLARADAFEGLLRSTRPRWIMDLRVVPLFDYDDMTRKRFFSLCRQQGIIYRDVSGLAEVSSRRDASLSSGSIVALINELLQEHPVKGAPGPLLFLLENAERLAVAAQVLPLLLQPRPPEGWLVCMYAVQ